MYDKSIQLGYDPSNELTMKQYVESFAERHRELRTKASAASGRARMSRMPKQARGSKKKEGDLQAYVFDGAFMEKHAPELRNDFSDIPVFEELTRSSPTKPVPYFFLGPADSGLWFHKHGE